MNDPLQPETTTSPPLFVAASVGDAWGRPRLANLLGADFSALSITPARGDLAPNVVRAALTRLSSFDAANDTDLAEWHVADHGDAGAVRDSWDGAAQRIMTLARYTFDTREFTISLGGDHSVTWPLVEAYAQVYPNVGIIQLDVHHDVRPLDHGPSNGTPIRSLIDRGVVKASNVVQIGIHPFGNQRAHHDWVHDSGVHVVPLAEVREDGADGVSAHVQNVLTHCEWIYLTVDIDVLDRAYAPGTVAALHGGLDPAQLQAIVERVCTDYRVMGMDIVEFDPERDVSGITAQAVVHTMYTALSAVARRRQRRL